MRIETAGIRVGSFFCYAVLCVLSSYAIILLGKRELVALLLFLSSGCHVAVIVLCLFLTVPWVQVCSIDSGIFSHPHLLLDIWSHRFR